MSTQKISKRKEATKKSCIKIDQCFNPSKKLKKSQTPPSSNSKSLHKTLLQLPLSILEGLLIFLDVSSLEKLGATCSFFHQLIFGRNITTLDFPFSPTFISELRRELVFEKKPLLRLRNVHYTQGVPDVITFNYDYLISLQLALLSLDSLRELYLVPDAVSNWADNHELVSSHVEFYNNLIYSISIHGNLGGITRLDILVNQYCSVENWIKKMPSLLHIGLTLASLKPIRAAGVEYILCHLESIVATCRAPNLSVKVLKESRKPIKVFKTTKVFRNSFVKKLTLCLPCNFNLRLAMPALQEVVLEHQEPTCTFFKSSPTDRALHRSGLCGVSLASCFHNCRSIDTFAGVAIGNLSQDQSFSKWSNELRKPFHSDYLAKGGQQDLETWSKVRGGRWFCK